MDTFKTDIFFGSPIYKINKPEFVESAIKATDIHIQSAKERVQKQQKEKLGADYEKVKDHGQSYHSDNLVDEEGLKDLKNYIGNSSHNLLDQQGFNMKKHTMFFTEFWVQEFAHNGGGHHDTHTHYDNHISGFYFLKCSNKTSYPVFSDPRHGANMARLELKENRSPYDMGNDLVELKPKVGDLVFFNSYMPHQFTVDNGLDEFRFIHFNLQAVRNVIVDTIVKSNEVGML